MKIFFAFLSSVFFVLSIMYAAIAGSTTLLEVPFSIDWQVVYKLVRFEHLHGLARLRNGTYVVVGGDKIIHISTAGTTGLARSTKNHVWIDDVAATSDGGYVLINENNTVSKYTENDLLEWTYQARKQGNPIPEGQRIIQTKDGGYVYLASVWNSSGEYYDPYIVSITGSGYTRWSKTVDLGENAYPVSLKESADGGFIIIGFTGKSDYTRPLLLKTDAAGNVAWSQDFDSPGFMGNAVEQTKDGGYILGIHSSHASNGKVAKTDGLGKILWIKNSLPFGVQSTGKLSNGIFFAVGQNEISKLGCNLMLFDALGNTSTIHKFPSIRKDPMCTGISAGGAEIAIGARGQWIFKVSPNLTENMGEYKRFGKA